MTEDLFTWADRSERNAARREARRRREMRRSFCTSHKKRSDLPKGHSAEIVDLPDRRSQRMDRLLDSALAAHRRSEQRASGAMLPAPILPFGGDRKQA